MMYDFECPACNKAVEVYRHHTECGLPEFCTCGEQMKRVFTANFGIKVYGYYSQAHGKHIKNEKDLRTSVHGKEMVPLDGPVKPPKKKSYDLGREDGGEVIRAFKADLGASND